MFACTPTGNVHSFHHRNHSTPFHSRLIALSPSNPVEPLPTTCHSVCPHVHPTALHYRRIPSSQSSPPTQEQIQWPPAFENSSWPSMVDSHYPRSSLLLPDERLSPVGYWIRWHVGRQLGTGSRQPVADRGLGADWLC